MLRQGMVVARQAVATLLKSWFNDVVYFLFDMVCVPVFTYQKPIPHAGARG